MDTPQPVAAATPAAYLDAVAAWPNQCRWCEGIDLPASELTGVCEYCLGQEREAQGIRGEDAELLAQYDSDRDYYNEENW